MTVLRSTVCHYDPIFEEARKSFLETIPEHHLSTLRDCHSAQQLLTDVEKWDIATKTLRRTKRVLSPVKVLSDVLEPYLDILGVFVNSNPEYAALVWGAFRLILKVRYQCSKFTVK
jgi:hypothetical protein